MSRPLNHYFRDRFGNPVSPVNISILNEMFDRAVKRTIRIDRDTYLVKLPMGLRSLCCTSEGDRVGAVGAAEESQSFVLYHKGRPLVMVTKSGDGTCIVRVFVCIWSWSRSDVNRINLMTGGELFLARSTENPGLSRFHFRLSPEAPFSQGSVFVNGTNCLDETLLAIPTPPSVACIQYVADSDGKMISTPLTLRSNEGSMVPPPMVSSVAQIQTLSVRGLLPLSWREWCEFAFRMGGWGERVARDEFQWFHAGEPNHDEEKRALIADYSQRFVQSMEDNGVLYELRGFECLQRDTSLLESLMKLDVFPLQIYRAARSDGIGSIDMPNYRSALMWKTPPHTHMSIREIAPLAGRGEQIQKRIEATLCKVLGVKQ